MHLLFLFTILIRIFFSFLLLFIQKCSFRYCCCCCVFNNNDNMQKISFYCTESINERERICRRLKNCLCFFLFCFVDVIATSRACDYCRPRPPRCRNIPNNDDGSVHFSGRVCTSSPMDGTQFIDSFIDPSKWWWWIKV